MATSSKAKQENQNLTRTRSTGRKPKLASSEDGSDQKPEKRPLPNYLKPTISSKPDNTVKLSKKKSNIVIDDNQKPLRRRSFDRPTSSLTSPNSTSSQRIPKSLNVSPSRPRDRHVVPKEKHVIGLRSSSSSSHGSRGGPRGVTPHVATKKSGLLNSGTASLKAKKKGHAANASDKEIILDSASLSSAQEDHEEEILKVDSDLQASSNDIESPKDEKETEKLHIEVVKADELADEPSVVGDDCIVVDKEIEKKEEEEEKLIIEEKTEEETTETKEQEEDEQESKGEDEEETKENINEDETPENVNIVEETTEEKEEVVEEEEKELVDEEENEKVKEEEDEEKTKREVVIGNKESPSAYNDVIASKIQENPRKNKVLALAGAFQTVIDYETASSK